MSEPRLIRYVGEDGETRTKEITNPAEIAAIWDAQPLRVSLAPNWTDITEHVADDWRDRLGDLQPATFTLNFGPPEPPPPRIGPFVFRLHGRPKAFRATATFETTGLSVIDGLGTTITFSPADAARLRRYIHTERYARLRRMHTAYPRRWKSRG